MIKKEWLWINDLNKNKMENNRLIAEFMGLPEQNNAYENPYSGEYVEAIELSYDESWDWLMPVVVECFKQDTAGHMRLNDALLTCNIEELYKTVVEFIKEHNDEEQ